MNDEIKALLKSNLPDFDYDKYNVVSDTIKLLIDSPDIMCDKVPNDLLLRLDRVTDRNSPDYDMEFMTSFVNDLYAIHKFIKEFDLSNLENSLQSLNSEAYALPDDEDLEWMRLVFNWIFMIRIESKTRCSPYERKVAPYKFFDVDNFEATGKNGESLGMDLFAMLF